MVIWRKQIWPKKILAQKIVIQLFWNNFHFVHFFNILSVILHTVRGNGSSILYVLLVLEDPPALYINYINIRMTSPKHLWFLLC